MAFPAPSPRPPQDKSLPVATIVALVGKGMTAREILQVFPELKPDDIRTALLTAVDCVCDKNVSLQVGDPVGAIIRQAQESSGLSDDEAMELAVSETRAVRRERAARRK